MIISIISLIERIESLHWHYTGTFMGIGLQLDPNSNLNTTSRATPLHPLSCCCTETAAQIPNSQNFQPVGGIFEWHSLILPSPICPSRLSCVMSSGSLQILMVLADSVPISTNQSYLHVRSENQHQSNTYHMRAHTKYLFLKRGKVHCSFRFSATLF